MNFKLTFKSIRLIIYLLIFSSFITFYFLLVNPIIFGIQKKEIGYDFDENRLRDHVIFLTDFEKQRTYKNFEALNKVGDYIYDYFEKSKCDKVYFQPYFIKDEEYRNIVCYFEGESEEKIVIGAHYDVYGEYSGDVKQVFGTYAGADDNASGVAGILELSKALGENLSVPGGYKNKLKNSIEIVAYTLEEPPFFDSDKMGSYVHAKSLSDNGEKIKYMISLEMIGYFSDEEIQTYPVRFLNRLYPDKGDFIAIVGKMFDTDIKELKKNMISYSSIDTWSLSAPKFIPGIGLSDHRNYWNFGYKAYMITDTSFFRNKNYHTAKDTTSTLDFSKMKEVVKGVYGIIIH